MNSGSNNLKSNRIAEYIVVIGAGDVLVPLSIDEQKNYAMLNPLKMDYTTSILDRYPLEDKPDISLPSGLTLFCLPHGLQIYEGPRSPKFFSFIQTSDRGLHLLGCCLVFFECLTDSQLQSLKDLLKTHNLPPEYATPSKGKKFFIPKCLCLISQWPFVESFKKYLRFLYSLSLNPSHIPIEKYISNFLEDVPAPPPGRVEVLYCVGNENLSFQRPPTNEPNVWSGLPMKPLFECFSNGDVLQLMGCVICERQIVFVSSQYSLLSSCAEVLLSLIYPLTWTHVYIPILPRRLIGKQSALYLHPTGLYVLSPHFINFIYLLRFVHHLHCIVFMSVRSVIRSSTVHCGNPLLLFHRRDLLGYLRVQEERVHLRRPVRDLLRGTACGREQRDRESLHRRRQDRLRNIRPATSSSRE